MQANQASQPEPVTPTEAGDYQPPKLTLPTEMKPTDDPTSSVEPDTLYRVRAGLFSEKGNADKLAEQLAAAGFVPAVGKTERGGSVLYSVQVGAFVNRDAAAALMDSLRGAGFDAYVSAGN